MVRAERAARALHRAQRTRDRADRRIAFATALLRAIALYQRTDELHAGAYVVRVGEEVSVEEVPHIANQLSFDGC
jgi:hypothetical protein